MDLQLMYLEQQKDSALLRQRRVALSENSTLLGIDFAKLVMVYSNQASNCKLEVHFISALNPNILATITSDNIIITGEADDSDVPFTIVKVYQPTAEDYPTLPKSVVSKLLVIELNDHSHNAAADTTCYTVSLVNVSSIDPFFSATTFRRQENLTTSIDCKAELQFVKPVDDFSAKEIPIHYLAKDYASFRQLMLSRLAMQIPDWPQDNPADFGNVIVEILAYAADQLSYYQDAVATEAYLTTARKRVSVRRHARLLNYHMHEGCNARVWVQVQVGNAVLLNQDAVLLTQTANNYPVYIKGLTPAELEQFVEINSCIAFSTLYPVNLYPEHNEINFYTWGSSQFSLPAGTTNATLQKKLTNLKAGDVLIFEQIYDSSGQRIINFTQRHAVRLLTVKFTQDNLSGTPVEITEISWHPADALPFDLTVAVSCGEQAIANMSVARGNIVLADHGLPILSEDLSPAAVPQQGNYRPSFKHRNLTFAVPFDAALALTQSANEVMQQDPHAAQPVIKLLQDNQIWSAQSDLLSSNHLSQHFVVEIENDRQAYIRFGDGVFGKTPIPNTQFKAHYRSGNGCVGNIGAEALAHIITFNTANDQEMNNIFLVRNLLPAQGGVDPESIAQVKLLAPHAFTKLQRCVIPQDYVQILEQHPEVKRAAAITSWTGSWSTIFIAVERKDTQQVDTTFKNKLLKYLAPFKMMGHKVAIIPPRFVPLDIALVVKVKAGYSLNAIRNELNDRFSRKQLANNKLGFFHPERLSFGESVYLSQVIAETMAVAGVDYVDISSSRSRFQRLDKADNPIFHLAQSSNSMEQLTTLPECISIGALEIAQLTNNSNSPDEGQIIFYVENQT